ncbi:MAG: allantoicase [Solirubrobacteraceae bacterium]|nr:allantoicase [Solirubrobacteraceae bacterium]
MSSPFTDLPDLAGRLLGGSVPWANDELFASRDNLIEPHDAEFRPKTFGTRGQVYDGWETRRRRSPGYDEAIIRLGVPGVVVAVDIDTAHFIGNYPPEASIEGCAVPGYPNLDVVQAAEWRELVPRSLIDGNSHNRVLVLGHADPYDDDAIAGELVTHVRLKIYPDGGVARLRVHGIPIIDPRIIDAGPFDLAALENGGLVTGSSNAFYSSATNLILPGPARTMGEGWETSRRRDDGHDWVEFGLAATGHVKLIEIDASHFVGNAPGAAMVEGRNGEDAPWVPVLDRTPLQPNIRHRFPVPDAGPLTHLRMNVYPDGGLARFRAYGTPTPEARAAIGRRFAAALPFDMASNLF